MSNRRKTKRDRLERIVSSGKWGKRARRVKNRAGQQIVAMEQRKTMAMYEELQAIKDA